MTEYGPKERYGRKFAENTMLGDTNENFFEKSIDEQVDEIAWTEGCPVKDAVKKRNGPEGAKKRYGEVIFTREVIMDEVKAHNSDLFPIMNEDIRRNPNEPVGEHEQTSVPADYLTMIPMTNTPWGYSLPRILVVQFGSGKDRTPEKMIKGLQILEKSIKDSKSPLELIARLANNITNKNSLITDAVLKQAFSKGHLGEQNDFHLYQELLGEIKKHAPKLYKRYLELSLEERAEKGIASL